MRGQIGVELPARLRGGDEPPGVDDYEKATEPCSKDTGLWREADVGPGEWFVVYWNGFIGLANKSLNMPPDAILGLMEAFRADPRDHEGYKLLRIRSSRL